MEVEIPALQGIIALIIVGLLMVAAEVFVPGMILGILGGICLAIAVVWSYSEYGVLTGTMVFVGVGFFGLVGFLVWMKTFSKTFIGRQVINRDVLEKEKSNPRAELLGKTGMALTALRPSGVAKLDGRRVDVVAESNFIDSGEAVSVVTVEGNRVVVRKNL